MRITLPMIHFQMLKTIFDNCFYLLSLSTNLQWLGICSNSYSTRMAKYMKGKLIKWTYLQVKNKVLRMHATTRK